VPNHLAGEPSPYLQQHADNPVDWYPWCDEAFQRAEQEDKPIFLSIGYSACHWCHVMERESFTDAATARFLNEHFISIKVDREERPDLDAIYMQAVTAMTGQGGWPLSVWLTPDGAPFYGGTYFPPAPRYGMPSFPQVLKMLVSVWSGRRQDIHETAASLLAHLDREDETRSTALPRERLLAGAMDHLRPSFDPVYGGWGEAPKFPQPLLLEFLLARRRSSTQPQVEQDIELTLDAMVAGGIYDHLGGGFHRYSTDERWLVPHFEKMLYDNAQLARCYLHAWQSMGKPRYREVAEETLDYLIREMQHPLGGFFSATDADSEGEEGAFFVWTPQQIREALPAGSADDFMAAYGVTAAGNFEGANILHRPLPPAGDRGAHLDTQPDLSVARAQLFAVREQRPYPARDDKILAGWNGLALAALAEAARALRSDRYREVAIKTGRFIQESFVRPGSRLAHLWKDGQTRGNGFLEDYACVIEGLIALYQLTFAENWYQSAKDLADSMVEHFKRPAGGFYDTSDDHEDLVVRPRSLQDSLTPSGNAMAATVLLKLGAYAGDTRYTDLAEETMATSAELVNRAPGMFGQWLLAYHLADSGITELAIVGDLNAPQTAALLSVATEGFRPTMIIAAHSGNSTSAVPLLEVHRLQSGEAASAWVCRRSTCLAPVTDPQELAGLLDS